MLLLGSCMQLYVRTFSKFYRCVWRRQELVMNPMRERIAHRNGHILMLGNYLNVLHVDKKLHDLLCNACKGVRAAKNEVRRFMTVKGSVTAVRCLGFNCGEAANLATPEWLKVAKEAAVRRAAMNYLPMLSHQQLLYILALAFHSRIPMSLATEPRSSRLKDRKRGEGETIVKKFFVNDVIENNHLLSILLKKGSSCSAVLWNSANFSCGFPSSPLCFSTMCNTKSSTAFRVNSLEVSTLPSVTAVNNSMPECLNKGMRTESFSKIKKESISVSTGFDFVLVDNFQREKQISSNHGIFSDDDNARGGPSFNRDMPFDDMHLDSGPLACVACGVLGFASMAVIQPCEKAARILLPANHKICHTYCGTSGTGTVRYDTASDGAATTANWNSSSGEPIASLIFSPQSHEQIPKLDFSRCLCFQMQELMC
eukprot:Gb_15928 [translate_table: standard]